MSEQELDGPNVSAPFQQMDGKGVPQRVGCDGLLQARHTASLLTALTNGIPGNGLTDHFPWEQPSGRPYYLPIGPQDFKQLAREHDIAVFLPLALLDAQSHALAVDVADFQMSCLGDPEASSVDGAEEGALFEIADRSQKPHGFLWTEDDWATFGAFSG